MTTTFATTQLFRDQGTHSVAAGPAFPVEEVTASKSPPGMSWDLSDPFGIWFRFLLQHLLLAAKPLGLWPLIFQPQHMLVLKRSIIWDMGGYLIL